MSATLTSRGPMGYAGAALAGGLSAAAFAVAIAHAETVLVFLSYLAAIPLFVAGLGAGNGATAIASATGAVGVFLIHPGLAIYGYALIYALPVMGITAMALRYRQDASNKTYWYPEGYLLTIVTILPGIGFLILYAMMMEQPGGLLGISSDIFKAIADQYAARFDAAQMVMMHTIAEKLARIAPSIAGCAWIMIMIISVIVSQVALEKNKANLRTGFSLQELHIPNWLIYGAAVTAIITVAAPAPFDYIGLNLSIMLAIPFFFVGLAVMHAVAARTPAPVFFLVFFYLLISLPPTSWLSVIVALVGAADQWGDFRQRLAAGPKKKA